MVELKNNIKYDNCAGCISNCEHAGKDREFVCIHGVSCKKTYSAETLIEEMQRGKFVKISGCGYAPAVFWMSEFNEKINSYSAAIGGAFPRDDLTLDELKKHFSDMILEGLTVKAFDILVA